MFDIRCRVCGEPWDGTSDMPPWQAKLFRQGAGCPSCEGDPPSKSNRDQDDRLEDHVRDVVSESEDPDSFTSLHEPDAPRPKWERPEDPTVFECAGCDSKIIRNLDLYPDPKDLTADLEWRTPTVDRYYYHRPGGYDWPLEVERLHEIDGKRYCYACATTCDECCEAVFRSNESCTGTILYGDSYDSGASHPHPNNHGTICTGCREDIRDEDDEDDEDLCDEDEDDEDDEADEADEADES